MWCPKCKSEYIEGIIKCPECEVPLVYELPKEPDIKTSVSYVKYQEVLYTHNQGDIAVIKSILDSAGIIYYLKGERISVTRPWADPAILMVIKNQVDTAKELLKDFI